VNISYVQERLHALVKRNKIIEQILHDISQHNATAYLVGGAVRDLVAGLPIVDIDIEVHNISLEDLSELLRAHGEVSYVGKVYGVFKLNDPQHGHIDWSIPRHDTAGRKPEVAVDPHMGIRQALVRRDVTMNAMALNMHTGELADPFNGYEDLKQGVLRTPDPDFFVEDPLRFYRVMQFIGRFNMWPDETLNNVCAKMNIADVSRERIEGECEKLLLRARRPSQGFRWLASLDRLRELFPEVADMRGVQQSPLYHPEGDVFTHTMQVIDAAAFSVLPSSDDQLLLMYAALCHDLGKPHATQIDAHKRVHSHGHDEAGVEPARQLLRRCTGKQRIQSIVPKMVRHHMAPGVYGRQSTRLAKYKLLAAELAPEISLYLLSVLCYADHRGRNGYAAYPLAHSIQEVDTFMKKAEEAGVLFHPEQRVVTGSDVLDLVEQGPQVGTLVEKAYDIQLREDIRSSKERMRGFKGKQRIQNDEYIRSKFMVAFSHQCKLA